MIQPQDLGPYRIGEPLGKGGMGSVYRATHRESGDQVAVKVLNPRLSLHDAFRERFEGEIESLKALRHVGIVRLFGYGEENGVLFFAMELVDGASLEEELRQGRRFNWREVAQIGVQVCRALKHAHDHGVIHRDLKPANILLAADGQPKLADFGIARVFGSTGVTIAGGVLGTADYMSPEQAAGKPVTARCDQYSLGGVLYALLAGRPPFRASDLTAVLQLQRFAIAESVRRFAPDTPEELDRIITQLLEKDPADRFPNTLVVARRMEAMSKALTRVAPDDFELEQARQAETPPAPHGESIDIDLAETQDANAPPLGDSVADDEPLAGSPGVTVSSHYTTVAEDAAAARRRRLAPGGWMATVLPTLSLLLALVAIGAIAVWALRPASADTLHERVEASILADGPTAAASDAAAEFLDRFPDDPRAPQVDEWRRTLHQRQLRRRLRLEKLADRVNSRQSTAENLHQRAARLAARDPVAGAAMFDQVATVLSANGDFQDALLAELARDEAARLRENIAERDKRLCEFLAERLAGAQKLMPKESATAVAVARSVLSLAPESEAADTLRAEANALIEAAAVVPE